MEAAQQLANEVDQDQQIKRKVFRFKRLGLQNGLRLSQLPRSQCSGHLAK